MSLAIQVTLDRANRRKDKSVSLTFITQLEQNSDEFKSIDEMIDLSGVLYFSEKDQLTKEEKLMIDEIEMEVEGKTKSERLRNVLYILWKQQGENGIFDMFYSTYMENLISKVKLKLD